VDPDPHLVAADWHEFKGSGFHGDVFVFLISEI
jgi:hypothetical protein